MKINDRLQKNILILLALIILAFTIVSCAKSEYTSPGESSLGESSIKESSEEESSTEEGSAAEGYIFIDKAKVEHVIEFAGKQLNKTMENLPTDSYPKSTKQDGQWTYTKSVMDGKTVCWTEGYFPGCLWYMYEITGNEEWRKKAETITNTLEEQKNSTNSHNVGVLLLSSFGEGYRLTQNQHYKEVLLTGAKSLATRYNDTFKAYDALDWSKKWDFVVNADSLISMDIMFWAAENGGDPQYKDMTLNHFKKAADILIRENGSMYQLASFKTNVWNLEYIGAHQGYSDNTTWSRGQGWGIRSFPVAYSFTKDPVMLEAAIKVSDYYINNIPSDWVPFWDFETPTNPDEEKDSSAASVSACGMFKLSEIIEDEALKRKYWNAGVKILDSLCSPEYLAENSIHQGLLLHGVGKHPTNVEVNVSLIYGDYYFMQALSRYLNAAKELSQ